MSWQSPRLVRDPVMAQIVRSLELFLKRPKFAQGIDLGDGTVDGGDADAGIQPQPPTIPVDSTTLTVIDEELEGLEDRFPIETVDISDEAVTAPKVAANAVTADKIAANAVTAGKIAANQVLVGHTLKSTNYDGTDGTDGTTGVYLGANGKFEAEDARIRGDIEVDRLTTIPGSPTGGFIEIDSTAYGANLISFPQPSTDEVVPARVVSHVNGFGIQAPTPAGSLAWAAQLQVARDVLTGDGSHGYILADVIDGPFVVDADEFVVNDIDLTNPPRRTGDRWSGAVSVVTGTATTIVCTSTYNISSRPAWVGGGAAVAFNTTTGAFTPQVAGRYEVRITGGWAANATAYVGSVGFRFNTTDYFPSVALQGQGLGTTQQAIFEYVFNGSTDVIYPRVLHLAASNRSFTLQDFSIRWVAKS